MARKGEKRRGTGAVRAAPRPRGASQRRHDPAGGDLADGVVILIADIDVASAVNRHAAWKLEARRGTRAVRAARHARRAGQRCNGSVDADLADGLVSPIGDIDVTGAVDRNIAREVEARRSARSIHASRATGVAREKLELQRPII